MAALTYNLTIDCLDKIADSAGVVQIEGGKVLEKSKHVANYSSMKRTSCGTAQQNSAMVWFTILYLGEKPPQNMTLHGSHDFGTGGHIGSVSAASSAFAARIGKQFKRVANTLTID